MIFVLLIPLFHFSLPLTHIILTHQIFLFPFLSIHSSSSLFVCRFPSLFSKNQSGEQVAHHTVYFVSVHVVLEIDRGFSSLLDSFLFTKFSAFYPLLFPVQLNFRFPLHPFLFPLFSSLCFVLSHESQSRNGIPDASSTLSRIERRK